MIDFNKPVQTRDGRQFRLLCQDAKSPWPVVGLYRDDTDTDTIGEWMATGAFTKNNVVHALDLVNVPEKRTVTVRIYETPDGMPYATVDYDANALGNKLLKTLDVELPPTETER